MNPYSNLKQKVTDYADKIQNIKRRCVGVWSKDSTALDAAELRTMLRVAERLGYIVEVKFNNGQVAVYYVDQLPSRPWF